MPYLAIDEFKRGLYGSTIPFSIPQGALAKAKNVHINRGAEVEKRKAFVLNAQLPANTFGLGSDGSTLHAFGSVVAPAMPAGYTYQRLQHPDGSAMTAVVRIERFGGKFYVVADFADGRRLHFYDGAIINDWYAGVVRSSMVDNSGIATHIAALIDADEEYSASAVGNIVTISGPNGRAFTLTTETKNGGAVDNQSATAVTTQVAVTPIAETTAQGSFRITGGTSSPGNNRVASVTVGGVAIMGAPVDWSGSNANTAALVAAAIQSFVSSPNYAATASGDKVIITAAPGAGASAVGLAVEVTCEGNVIACTGQFTITAGTASAGVNEINAVVVDGVTILSNVDWITSHSQTAQNAADAINLSADYNACAIGATVQIGRRVTNSNQPKTLNTLVDRGGNVTTTTLPDQINEGAGDKSFTLNTTVENLTGGLDAFVGTPQIVQVTIGGTFEAGDQFTVTIEDAIRGELVFGVGDVTGQSTSAVIAFGEKMYAGVGPLAQFTALNSAIKWNSGDGQGFVSMATHQSGLTSIVSFARYQKKLAILGRAASQIWNMDPDPDNNSLFQALENFGTIAARSPQAYGFEDVFLLADSGVRSLRQSAATELANTFDVGTPIDDLIVSAIAANPTGAAAAHSVVEPSTNAYWLMLNGTLYVLSKYPHRGVEAWSTYEGMPAFEFFATHNGRVYARHGNDVYLYGGSDNATYDTSQAEVTLAYVNARKVATWKQWFGMDLAVKGLWEVYANTDPNNPSTEDLIARQFQPSFHDLRNSMLAQAPAIKLRFVSTAAERAVVSQAVLHYEEADAA